MVHDEFIAISKPPVDNHAMLFHVMYSWHLKNKTATKTKLAVMLNECGLHKQAIALDPKCEFYVKTDTGSGSS